MTAPVPTQEEMVPESARSAMAVIPVGTWICQPCDVTWNGKGAGSECWYCGETGQGVQALESILGHPVAPRLHAGRADMDMAASDHTAGPHYIGEGRAAA